MYTILKYEVQGIQRVGGEVRWWEGRGMDASGGEKKHVLEYGFLTKSWFFLDKKLKTWIYGAAEKGLFFLFLFFKKKVHWSARSTTYTHLSSVLIQLWSYKQMCYNIFKLLTTDVYFIQHACICTRPTL